jgi:hypothetical protein
MSLWGSYLGIMMRRADFVKFQALKTEKSSDSIENTMDEVGMATVTSKTDSLSRQTSRKFWERDFKT